MVRENLIAALNKAAEELGYTASFSDKLPKAAKKCGFPLICVEPLRIVSTSGSRDCRVVYRVKMKLLVLSDALSSEPETVWQRLECDAVALYRVLASDRWVEAVSDFGCTPCEVSQTPMGDVALVAEFTVAMFYCV